MRYIEYLSGSKYGRVGIKHSVISDGKYVLSYEMKTPLGEGEFKLYNYKEWVEQPKEITLEKEIKYFKIKKYKGVKLNGVTCFEALNQINPMITIKERIKRTLTTLIVLGVYGTLCFLFGYYGFTMSEEEFLDYKQELCLE